MSLVRFYWNSTVLILHRMLGAYIFILEKREQKPVSHWGESVNFKRFDWNRSTKSQLICTEMHKLLFEMFFRPLNLANVYAMMCPSFDSSSMLVCRTSIEEFFFRWYSAPVRAAQIVWFILKKKMMKENFKFFAWCPKLFPIFCHMENFRKNTWTRPILQQKPNGVVWPSLQSQKSCRSSAESDTIYVNV